MGTVLQDSQHSTPTTNMKMLVVLALVAAAFAEPEAEADPLTYLNNYPSVHSAHALVSPLLNAFANPAVTYKAAVATPTVTYKAAVATPAVNYKAAVATPAITYNTLPANTYNTLPVATYNTIPATTYNSVASPLAYSHVPVSTHTLTSYKSPNHYTAVSNGAFGPSYVAKNGPTVHVVKREAEPESDPALLTHYNTIYNTLPATTYNTIPATTYNTLPATAYNTLSATAYNTLPATVYNTLPSTTYNNAAYNYAAPHAVAYTAAGLTHASNVGVCTNYLGQMVHC